MELIRDEARKAQRDLAFDVDAFRCELFFSTQNVTRIGDIEISTIFADSPSSLKHTNRPLKGDVHLGSIYPAQTFFNEWVVLANAITLASACIQLSCLSL